MYYYLEHNKTLKHKQAHRFSFERERVCIANVTEYLNPAQKLIFFDLISFFFFGMLSTHLGKLVFFINVDPPQWEVSFLSTSYALTTTKRFLFISIEKDFWRWRGKLGFLNLAYWTNFRPYLTSLLPLQKKKSHLAFHRFLKQVENLSCLSCVYVILSFA